MGELIPYIPGMQQGQGYNSYLQQLCVKNAVTIQSSEKLGNPVRREYRSELVEDYEKLAKNMKISAGAAVSGWGQSGNVNVSILDRSEFESSTLTYQVEVMAQHQGNVSDKHFFNNFETDTPRNTYGDRYIADFIRGGHFFARISITARNSSQTNELKQSAEVAFSMYGVEGKVTQEVEEAVNSVKRNSSIKITIIESTGTDSETGRAGSVAVKTEKSSDLLAVKAKADIFFEEARSGKHTYLLFAVLGKYTNLANFGNRFVPLDYSEASRRSWKLFDDFTLYQAIEKMIKTVPKAKFKSGPEQQDKLQNKAIDNFGNIRNRVLLIAERPEVARETPDHQAPDKFRLEFLNAVKTATYHAQSKPIPNSPDLWTDICLSSVDSTSTRIFTFSAYDFPSLIGTEVVSFGKSTTREDYICLIGERAGNIDGWKEESHFWAFPDSIEGFHMQMYGVSRAATKRLMRLYAADQSDIKKPRKGQMFWWFVPSTTAMYNQIPTHTTYHQEWTGGGDEGVQIFKSVQAESTQPPAPVCKRMLAKVLTLDVPINFAKLNGSLQGRHAPIVPSRYSTWLK